MIVVTCLQKHYKVLQDNHTIFKKPFLCCV